VSSLPSSRLIPARAARGGDDPIFALNAEAQRRRAAGKVVVNSTLGVLLDEEGRLATLPAVAEAYRQVPLELAAGYAPIAGPPAFLEAVQAELFGGSALAAQATAVATPGGTGALALAVANFLEPGQALLTSSFYWSPYETIADQAGRTLETFRMFTPGGRLDVEALAAALADQRRRQGRALLFLNTPCNNPTGYSFDADDWAGLVPVLLDEAERMPLSVLVDVAYARYGAGDPLDWVRALERLAGRATLLVAWSGSKAFAQYGARVGACVAVESDAGARERIAGALKASCRGLWSNVNHLGTLAVTRCMTVPELAARVERERGALRELLHARVALFTRLAREAGLHHPRYEGGFFVTVFCAQPERAAAVMREHDVFVVPVAGALRVALCSTSLTQVTRLVTALAAGIQACTTPD
jgi:aromatic-amino-acid transaminase